MEPKNQTQNQGSGSDFNSQYQRSTSHPVAKQPKDFTETERSSEEEDIQSDERRTSKNNPKKEATKDVHAWETPKDNEGWQTGDSRIPENASDNPNI